MVGMWSLDGLLVCERTCRCRLIRRLVTIEGGRDFEGVNVRKTTVVNDTCTLNEGDTITC